MSLQAKLRARFSPRKLDAEMAEEMRQHLELRTQANITVGMSPDEARYAAQRSFGGVEPLKEIARGERSRVWLGNSAAILVMHSGPSSERPPSSWSRLPRSLWQSG